MKEIEEVEKKGSCGCWSCGCLSALFGIPPLLVLIVVVGYLYSLYGALAVSPRLLNPKVASYAKYEEIEQRFDSFLSKAEENPDEVIQLSELDLNSLLVKRFNYKDLMVKVSGQSLTLMSATKSYIFSSADRYANCDIKYVYKNELELDYSHSKCFAEKESTEYSIAFVSIDIAMAVEDAHKPYKTNLSIDPLTFTDLEKERKYYIKSIVDGVVTIAVSKDMDF